MEAEAPSGFELTVLREYLSGKPISKIADDLVCSRLSVVRALRKSKNRKLLYEVMGLTKEQADSLLLEWRTNLMTACRQGLNRLCEAMEREDLPTKELCQIVTELSRLVLEASVVANSPSENPLVDLKLIRQ